FAYVAARPAASLNGSAVTSWRTLWEATYAGETGGPRTSNDPTLNTAGWISSYTGELISHAEMRQGAEHTGGRIRALRPKRVLEIGCGTGMLLFRIAPICEHYHGVDFSASALRYVEAEAARQGLGNVTLQQATADELTGLEARSFDLVILNSVVQ